MMSRLQPLNQGIITLLEKAYNEYIMGHLSTAIKVSDNIRAGREGHIFQCGASWDTVPEVAIKKDYSWYRIHEDMGQCEGSSPANNSLDAAPHQYI